MVITPYVAPIQQEVCGKPPTGAPSRDPQLVLNLESNSHGRGQLI